MAMFPMCRCVRLALTLALGGAFHAAWIALFILGASSGVPRTMRAVLWLAAPVITAAGYAAGLAVPFRGDPGSERGFRLSFGIVLVACAAGAIAGSLVGPMFVGMGVLAGGCLAALALAIGTRATSP